MSNGIYKVPRPINEPVKNYAPGSPERDDLKQALQEARSQTVEIPQYIGGETIFTDKRHKVSPPHDHQHLLGYFHEGDASHVTMAIEAALAPRRCWGSQKMPTRQKLIRLVNSSIFCGLMSSS